MLANARLQTLVCVSDLARSHAFYADVLELPFLGEHLGSHLFQVANAQLRVSPVPEWTPTGHTVFGFAVDDVRPVTRWLAGRGIACARIAGMNPDDDGVCVTPVGDHVAWFQDPDGNILSLVQYA